jgi:hypothetical protein
MLREIKCKIGRAKKVKKQLKNQSHVKEASHTNHVHAGGLMGAAVPGYV